MVFLSTHYSYSIKVSPLNPKVVIAIAKMSGKSRKHKAKRKEPESFMDGAFTMSTQLTEAFDKFADMFFQDLEDDEDLISRGLPDLEISAVTTASTDDSREMTGISYSTSAGDSTSGVGYLPPPPKILDSRVGSTASSAFTPVSSSFTPVRKPIAQNPSSFRNDSSFDSTEYDYAETELSYGTSMISSSMIESAIDSIHESEVSAREAPHIENHGSFTEVIIKSSPMARMRSSTLATATQLTEAPTTAPRSTAKSVSAEEAMASKHRKWRRHMKEAQRRKQEQKKRGREPRDVCATTTDIFMGMREEPGRLLQQLVKGSPIRCGTLDDTASAMLSDGTDSDASSDSDPKPLSPPRRSARNRPPRSERVDSPGASESSASQRNHGQQLQDTHEGAPSSTVQSTRTLLSHLSLQDRTFISTFIQETSQRGYPLIWHMPSTDGATFDPPLDIVAFLELGFLQTDGNFAGPRLAWYSPAGSAMGAIDLLDIKSLAKATPLQLSSFPFAIPSNSLILKLHNSFDELVLEASSAEDARRFIHGLRWVVARLTFNLIIGNPEVSCELLELSHSSTSSSHEMDKAMNDVTNQLVDKAVFNNPQQLV